MAAGASLTQFAALYTKAALSVGAMRFTQFSGC